MHPFSFYSKKIVYSIIHVYDYLDIWPYIHMEHLSGYRIQTNKNTLSLDSNVQLVIHATHLKTQGGISEKILNSCIYID